MYSEDIIHMSEGTTAQPITKKLHGSCVSDEKPFEGKGSRQRINDWNNTRKAQHVRDWRFYDSGDMSMGTTLLHFVFVSPICDKETRSGNLRREGRLPWRDNSSDRQRDNPDKGQGLPKSTRRES